MHIFIATSLAYIWLGFVPTFLVTYQLTNKVRHSLILGIGYAYVLLATINFVLASGIRYMPKLAWIIMCFINLALMWNTYKRCNLKSLSTQWKSYFISISMGACLGVLLWRLHFPTIMEAGHLFNDLIWNLGLTAEAQKNLFFIDPHWYTGEYFKYHLLTNFYIAALSSLSTIEPVYVSTIAIPLLIYISIGILLFLLARNHLIIIIVTILAITSTWNASWIGSAILTAQLSEKLANSFFWSLPIFISCLYLYCIFSIKRSNRISEILSLKVFLKDSLILWITFFPIAFAKASFIPIWISLEFFQCFILLLKRPLNKFTTKIIRFFPLAIAWIFLYFTFYSKGPSSLALHFTPSNVAGFPHHSIFMMYISVVGLPLIYLLFLNQRRSILAYCIILSACFNLGLFLAFSHKGNADLYFAFNGILLSSSVFLIAPSKNTNLPGICFLIFCLVIFLARGSETDLRNLPMHYSRTKRSQGLSWKDTAVKDLLQLSQYIGDRDIVLSPISKCRDFSISAFLKARIWSECHHYTHLYHSNSQKGKDTIPEEAKYRYNLVKTIAFSNEADCKQLIKETQAKWIIFRINMEKGKCVNDTPSYHVGDFVLHDLREYYN